MKGNQFVVGQDSPFRLRGLNASDTERLLKIEHWNKAYFEEIKRWKPIPAPADTPNCVATNGQKEYLKILDDGVQWAE